MIRGNLVARFLTVVQALGQPAADCLADPRQPDPVDYELGFGSVCELDFDGASLDSARRCVRQCVAPGSSELSLSTLLPRISWRQGSASGSP